MNSEAEVPVMARSLLGMAVENQHKDRFVALVLPVAVMAWDIFT